MTTGPKKLPKPENRLTELVDGAAEQFCAIQNSAADLERDEILAAGIDLGRIEAMDFVATVATGAIVAVYESISKSKAWKHLRNPESGDGSHFHSLEEFCEVKLGRSYRRMRDLAANKNSLGQEAFEQAERLGLRQSDYNLIRALPAPKQEIVKEALAEGASKEDLQRAIRELAAADQKEIEALSNERDATAKKLAEAEANYEAQGKVLADKDAKINSLTVERSKLAPPTPDSKAAELVAAAHEAEATACAWVEGHLRQAIAAILEHDDEHGSNHRAVLSGFIARIEDATDALRLSFALPRIKSGEDDPFAELPDDFLEQQGLTIATPINVDADGKLFDPAKLGGHHAAN